MTTKFAVIADLHFGPAKYDTPQHKAVAAMLPDIVDGVVQQINQHSDIEFIINLGDLVQDDSRAPSRKQDLRSAARVMEILRQFKKPLYHVVGNHDRVTLSQTDLREIFGHDLYYTFETTEHKHIVLHCESPRHINVHLVDGEREWLKRELDSSSKPVIVYMHQLLVTHALEGTSCEGMPDCAFLTNRVEVRELLERHGNVRAVINGHMHANLLKVENGIPYATIQALTEPSKNGPRTAEAFGIVEVNQSGFLARVAGNDPAQFKHTFTRHSYDRRGNDRQTLSTNL